MTNRLQGTWFEDQPHSALRRAAVEILQSKEWSDFINGKRWFERWCKSIYKQGTTEPWKHKDFGPLYERFTVVVNRLEEKWTEIKTKHGVTE